MGEKTKTRKIDIIGAKTKLRRKWRRFKNSDKIYQQNLIVAWNHNLDESLKTSNIRPKFWYLLLSYE